MLTTWWIELADWWATVPTDFAFLLALPLVVAVAGFVGEGIRRRRLRRVEGRNSAGY